MSSSHKKALVNSFWGSFLYVGAATLNLLIKWEGEPNTILEGVRLIVIVLTFPVTIISFGVLYAGGYQELNTILIIQLGSFLAVWYGVNKALQTKYYEEPLFREYYHLKEIINEVSLDMSMGHEWKYSFTSKDELHLTSLLEHLLKSGYKLESLVQNNGVKWILQVSKFEKLSIELLAKKNVEFIELAAKFELDSYEGWDILK